MLFVRRVFERGFGERISLRFFIPKVDGTRIDADQDGHQVDDGIEGIHQIRAGHDGLSRLQQGCGDIGFFLTGFQQADVFNRDRRLLDDAPNNPQAFFTDQLAAVIHDRRIRLIGQHERAQHFMPRHYREEDQRVTFDLPGEVLRQVQVFFRVQYQHGLLREGKFGEEGRVWQGERLLEVDLLLVIPDPIHGVERITFHIRVAQEQGAAFDAGHHRGQADDGLDELVQVGLGLGGLSDLQQDSGDPGLFLG